MHCEAGAFGAANGFGAVGTTVAKDDQVGDALALPPLFEPGAPLRPCTGKRERLAHAPVDDVTAVADDARAARASFPQPLGQDAAERAERRADDQEMPLNVLRFGAQTAGGKLILEHRRIAG